MKRTLAYYIKKGLKILLLSLVFVSLSKMLWHLSEVYFAKGNREDFQTLCVEAGGSVDTLHRFQEAPLIVHNQYVSISGRSLPSVEVELSVNDRNPEWTYPRADGKFTFSYIRLQRGLNTIQIKRSATEFSASEGYEVVFQGEKPQKPIMVSYQYNPESAELDLIGVGEPSYMYCLKFAGHVGSVPCDAEGTFRIALTMTAHDTVATLLTNTGIDTLLTIPIASRRGQYSIELPLIFSRTIELSVDSSLSHVEAKLTVRGLPTASTFYERMASGSISTLDFATALFGEIDINDYEQQQALPPKIMVSREYADIALQIAWDVPEEGQLSSIDFFPKFGLCAWDSVVLHVPERSEYSSIPAADAFAGNRKIWVGPKLDTYIQCSFTSKADQERLHEGSGKKVQLPNNVIDVFSKLPTEVFKTISPIGSILRMTLDAIFSGIPLIWWLWLIYRYGERLGRFQKSLLGTFALLTFFHFFSPFLGVLAETGYLIETFVRRVNNESLRYFAAWYELSYQDFGKFFIGGILLFNPLSLALVAPNASSPYQSSTKLKLVLGFGLAGLSLLFGYMFAVYFRGDLNQLFSSDISYYVSSCIAAAVVFTVLYFLGEAIRSIVNTTLQITLPRSNLYAVLLVMIGVPVMFDALTSFMNGQLSLSPPLLWAFVVSCFGAILLYSAMNIAFKLFLKQVPFHRTWLKVMMFLGFALVAFPKSFLIGVAPTFVDYSFLSNFFEITVAIFPFAVLFAIVAVLREDSSVRGYRMDSASKEWGLLLMSFFIVERGFQNSIVEGGLENDYTWMYIPIPLILAYFLSRQYLFMDPERASERLKKDELPLQERKSSIQKVISYLIFKKEFKDLKKLFDKKFGANEIELADWEKKKADNESVLLKLRNEAKCENVPLENVIFSLGAEASPWENAVQAIKVGTWLAIFWIFVFVREFRGHEIYPVYPLFDLADTFMYSMLLWFIIAFVFGYYYHILRGNTGIQKGAWFGLIIIVARIGPGIFFTNSIDQIQSLLIWGIQVFAYCMFVGYFAFDFRVLRKNDFGWQEVVVIHNLTALSAFGSGLLAALLGILSGQLQELFKSLLLKILPTLH